MREGAERRLALRLGLAPRRRCRVPLRGTPPPGAPLWRLPPRDRLVRSEPGAFTPVIRAAFAALHPDRTGLLAKAALRSKGGREPRATRTSVRVHRGAGATPAPSTKTPLEDALTEQACRQYRALRTAQEKCQLPLARIVEGGGKPNGFKSALQRCINTHRRARRTL